MEEVKVTEIEETEEKAELTETEEQKPSFKERVKAGFQKVKENKIVRTTAKVVGGAGLVAAGVVGTLLVMGKGDDSDVVIYDLDPEDVTEETVHPTED